MVHVYAGNLLMTTGAYSDAIKAFNNADTVAKVPVSAFQRARCYCAISDLENAKMQFKLALGLVKTDKLITVDSQVLTALLKAINAPKGQVSNSVKESLRLLEEII